VRERRSRQVARHRYSTLDCGCRGVSPHGTRGSGLGLIHASHSPSRKLGFAIEPCAPTQASRVGIKRELLPPAIFTRVSVIVDMSHG